MKPRKILEAGQPFTGNGFNKDAMISERPDVVQTIVAHSGDVQRVCDKRNVFVNNVSKRELIFCHHLQSALFDALITK